MLNSNMCLRIKLYNLEEVVFSGTGYSSVNVAQFSVISKADKQVCALQESLKEDYLGFETTHLSNASRVQNITW